MNSSRKTLADVLAEMALDDHLAPLESGESYEGISVHNAEMAELQLSELLLEQSRLTKSDFSHGQWRLLELREVLVDQCEIQNANWFGARLSQVEIHRARATGFNASESKWNDVRVKRSKLNLSVFHDATIQHGEFENCDLREADFQGARLTQVCFRECDLRGARFPGAKVDQLDLCGSQIEGIFLETDQLKNVIVDPTQVVTLAELIGITIK